MSSQAHGDSAGSSSSSSEYKKSSQGRRGGSNRSHYGRSPQTPTTAINDTSTSAQKRIRNLQQKSHEKSAEYKLRPQTGRQEHNKGADSAKPPPRNNSGQSKNKGNPHRKSQGHDSDPAETKSKKLPKENGATSKPISKDMKRYERKDSGIGHSPPSIEPPAELESTDPSIVDLSSSGRVGESDGEEQESVAGGKEGSAGPEVEVKNDRKQYTREELLSLSKSPASLKRHPSLNAAIDIMFLKSASTSSTEHEVEGVKKHPTALSLIKEHDARQLPKVSLSPQRKSFHGGCSWNDSKTPGTPSSAKDNSNQFDFESTYTPLMRGSQSSTQQGPPPISRHKVIDHVPLRDQELGRGNKKNWRERAKEPEWARDSHDKGNWEEEPEWMDFGPNDRFELIELKGLEEHEREREARLGREEVESHPEEEDRESPLSDQLRDHVESEQPPTSKKDTVSKDAADKPHKREVMLKAALEIDNFMLDGFDFSTGLSFCTALDDEEEVRSTQSTAEVGNALMKVLKIGGEEKELPSNKDKPESILGVSSRPVNALTLEEIHARENIQTTPTVPTPSVSSSEELGAFNKLVAGLQSSGALHKDHPEPVCPEPGPSTVKSSPSQGSVNPTPMSSASVPSVSAPFRLDNPHPPQNTFGSALEKEMEFDDEVITGSHPHYQRPPPEIPSQYSSRASRVEHLERMLEKLDQEQVMRDKHKVLHPDHSPHMASGYPEQHMKAKLLQSHSARMSRGPPMDGQRPMPMPERDYAYHDGEHRIDMLPPPNIGIRPQAGMNRSNHWAVEMERRRLMELKQMELKQMERVRMERAMYSTSMHGGMQHKMREVPPPPKPNISLLPTAVMRQMHNSKQNQPHSDVTKSNTVDSRPEQDFTMKSSHTPISSMYGDMEHPSPRLHPSQMYGMGGGGQMRSVPPFRPDPAAASMMYRGYYNMPVMPHGGMQNPYMY